MNLVKLQNTKSICNNQLCFYILFRLRHSGGLDSKEYACDVGDLGLIPGLGTSPGEGHGHPLQCSCLENAHGRGEPGGLQSMGSQKAGHN